LHIGSNVDETFFLLSIVWSNYYY